MAIIFILLLFSALPCLISSLSITLSPITKLPLPAGSTSPTTLTFNHIGEGPFIDSSDGRVLKYNRISNCFEPFAYTSPNRDSSCDNTNIVDRMQACGQPSGLAFNSTGWLFVSDDYYGLMNVGCSGGKASILVPTNSSVPPVVNLPIAVDVDVNGIVRFTDASSVTTPRDLVTGVGFQNGDNTGELYEYNPFTNKVNLLLSGLYAARGLATDIFAKYVLITESESNNKRVVKYWLEGEKAHTLEVVLNLTGIPRKIKRNINGHFWVASDISNNSNGIATVTPQGVLIDGDGCVLATVDFSKDYDKPIVSVTEHDGKLYVGARNVTFVGVYNIYYGL